MRFARFRPARRDANVGLDPTRRPSGLVARWRRRLAIVLPPVLVVVLHQVLFPPHEVTEQVRFEVGDVNDQDLRAPFEFEAPRPVGEVERLRREAEEHVEPVYRRDRDARRRTELSLETFLDRATELAAADSVPRGERVATLQRAHPGLRATTLRVVLDPERLPRIRAALDTVLSAQLDAGVVDVFPSGTYENVVILDGDGEGASVPVARLFLGYRFEDELESALRSQLDEPAVLGAAVDVGSYFLLPNLDFEESETAARRLAASDAVSPTRTYARNERIVDRGVRISRDHLDVIAAMEQARFEDKRRQDATLDQKIRGGRALLLLLVLVGAVRLVRQADPNLHVQTNRYVLLHVLWALFLAGSALVLARPEWGGAVLVPIVLIAMLSVIVFGEATAYRVVAAALLMLMVVPEHATPLVLAWSAIGVVAVRSLRRVRNRNQFYRSLGVVGVTAVVVVAAVEFSTGASLSLAAEQALRAVGAAAVCTALTLFLLPLFEASFGVTTELTLLELSDLNHPLLRRMSLESPGTFHHSQVVGTLAEAGSRAIGANSLLTRVGANFHDIGKMLKPRYFAENQGPANPHDELTPQMSALVIASHVKEGVELGRQWGLPPSVLAFIPEHHGTSVMQFFYKKALEADDGGTIKVDDFRYPGPKPQTRETAILMLADGCEASVRSLRRPTASRVREMVRKIFDQKLGDGELDECGLTLSEVAKVRESFIPILVGIHHQRVAYPGQREHEEKKEQESREARSRSRRGSAPVASNG